MYQEHIDDRKYMTLEVEQKTHTLPKHNHKTAIVNLIKVHTEGERDVCKTRVALTSLF